LIKNSNEERLISKILPLKKNTSREKQETGFKY